MSRICVFLFSMLCLCLSVSAKVAQQQPTLGSGQSVERALAGGESYTYEITLQAGQFVRFRLEQRAIDASLILTAPDGKQLVEMNLTRVGVHESLSLAATAAGSYRLTVRGNGSATQVGSYKLEATVTAVASAPDKQRLAAEALLLEAQQLLNQEGKDQLALEKLQRAIKLWQELGDAFWSAWSLERSSSAYNNLRQPEKAMECLEKASVLIREIKIQGLEASVLYSMGVTYQRLNQLQKAAASFEQARAIYREVKDPYYEGQALFNLGSTAKRLSQFEKAVEYNEGALTVFRELKDRLWEGRTLVNLGAAQDRLGRSEKALEYYQQGLAIFRELKNQANEENALNSLGTAYGGQGQFEKAIEYFEQSLVLSRDLKNKEHEGTALNNLGLAHFFLGQYESAITYLDQALQIAREIKDRIGEGHASGNLGKAYSKLGRTEKTIEYHEQALAIFRETKDLFMEGDSLQELGNAYASMDRHEKAIEYFAQALAISQEVKSRVGEADALILLGGSYRQLGRYEEAIAYNKKALVILREVKFPIGEAAALIEIGTALAKLKRHEKAIELYAQALAINREVKNPAGEGLSLLMTGESKLQLERTDEAVALFTESAAIQRAIGDRAGQFSSLSALAKAERKRGNLSQSRRIIEESLQLAESLRADVVSPESRTSLLASVQDAYQFYTDLLMRQHQLEPTKGFDALAVEVSERQRARSLLDLLTEARADVRQGVDGALLDRERSLGRQLNDKAQGLMQASTPEQVATLKQGISQLENDYERAQAAIRKASPHYAALTQPQPLKLKEIQQQLDADTLLLEYALGEERSYLWAITRDSLTSYELPKEELIKQNALQVYELLTARSASQRGETTAQRQLRITQAEAKLPGAAESLSQTLLKPVAAQLGNQRPVIVADGALQYIPFAMLPEPEFRVSSSAFRVQNPKRETPNAKLETRNSKSLIVNHEVVSLPSASALAIQRLELAGRQPAPKMLAVIADPVFDRTDARFARPATETGNEARPQAIGFDDARSIEHLAENSGDKSGVATVKLVIPRSAIHATGSGATVGSDSEDDELQRP